MFLNNFNNGRGSDPLPFASTLLKVRKKHPKGFYVVFLSLDLNKLFKKREQNWFNKDRDFCVYLWKDQKGVCQYIGMGRYYPLYKGSFMKWMFSRPFSHKNDLLVKCINKDWTCEILCYGMTSKEAHILEAYLIQNSGRELSKIGTKKWDKRALINKVPENRYKSMFEEYLNLDGNNYWETFGWKVHNN